MCVYFSVNETALKPAVCTCGAHVACSRQRLAMLNDMQRNAKLVDALQKVSRNLME